MPGLAQRTEMALEKLAKIANVMNVSVQDSSCALSCANVSRGFQVGRKSALSLATIVAQLEEFA